MVNTSDKMADINDLIENEQYSEAKNLFLLTIEELKKEHSPLFSEYCYVYAHFLFELQDYELCLFMFQSAYNLNYRKQEIEEFLYNSFIVPNDEEFKTSYEQHLLLHSSNIISSHVPSFDELPLDFIPYEDNKYMIFNKKLKIFEGLIDISDDSLGDYVYMEYKDEFSDIVLSDTWNIHSMKNCILSYQSRILYFISTNINMTLSFLKLPGILDRYCSNLKFIDSMDSFQTYLHHNTSVYLPRIYCGNSSSGTDNLIANIIEEEHQYRLTPEGRNTSNTLLTIGIPSYNRGHRLLKNLPYFLQSQYDAEIEFVISNNGSVQHIEEYEEVENIKDSRIQYVRLPDNIGANANFCHVLSIAKGKYTCLLSDEDSINLPAITHYLHILKSNPNISFAKSCGLNYYTYNTNKIYPMGSEAFLQSFLSTNYLSGLIYRSDLVHTLNIYQWTLDNMPVNEGVYYYSHSCWVMFFTLYGDYYEDSMLLFREGTVENDQNTTSVGNTTAKPILVFATLESRINQHNGFIMVLNQLKSLIDKATFLSAYLSLCFKTIFLLSLVKRIYVQTDTSWDTICNEVFKCCCEGLSKINMKLTDKETKMLTIKITEIIAKYRD